MPMYLLTVLLPGILKWGLKAVLDYTYLLAFKSAKFKKKSVNDISKLCIYSFLLCFLWIRISKNCHQILQQSVCAYNTTATSTMYISVTSLLPNTVAQPTKWIFLPKNSSQLAIFVIGLAFTWVWGDKNHQNLIFKVNFLCQKSVLLFWYLFLLKLLD